MSLLLVCLRGFYAALLDKHGRAKNTTLSLLCMWQYYSLEYLNGASLFNLQFPFILNLAYKNEGKNIRINKVLVFIVSSFPMFVILHRVSKRLAGPYFPVRAGQGKLNMVVRVSLSCLLLASSPVTVINEHSCTMSHSTSNPPPAPPNRGCHRLLGQQNPSSVWPEGGTFLPLPLCLCVQGRQQMEGGQCALLTALYYWSNASPLWVFKTQGLVNRGKGWGRKREA